MGVIVHLSDLHLLAGDPESDAVLASLVAALEADRRERDREVDLVVITGDVFDTATLEPSSAVREMLALHASLQHVLGRGRAVPTVVVPGNHDRRRLGLFGPHRATLFDALRAAAPPELWVHGGGGPFLAEVVPHAVHRLPLHLVAYDSTYLPTGYLSAGGNVRSEDLLHAASQVGSAGPGWPIVLLLHHHLVPTPVTDTGPIETHRLGKLAHTSLRRILPTLVTHADREELTMTAMGAGSVLSLLHSFERPVLVLHGHKHIASARKLEGMRDGEGDVILASAGSAATAQRWSPRTDERWADANSGGDAVRIWPSFNVVELDGDALAIETVSFGWKGRSAGRLANRPLVWAERRGARWSVTPTTSSEPRMGPALRDNRAYVRLWASVRHASTRFDSLRVRELELGAGRELTHYREVVDGLVDGSLAQRDRAGRTVLRADALPATVTLPLTESTELDVLAAIPRTLAELRRAHGAMSPPFPTLSLFNRYASSRASLVVEGLGALGRDAFASVLDLGSGRERAMRLERTEGHDRVALEVPDCPPRTLLRVHWPAVA
jgi:3',5'-cyclic AMP phosphodiesterase CpdA